MTLLQQYETWKCIWAVNTRFLKCFRLVWHRSIVGWMKICNELQMLIFQDHKTWSNRNGGIFVSIFERYTLVLIQNQIDDTTKIRRLVYTSHMTHNICIIISYIGILNGTSFPFWRLVYSMIHKFLFIFNTFSIPFS